MQNPLGQRIIGLVCSLVMQLVAVHVCNNIWSIYWVMSIAFADPDADFTHVRPVCTQVWQLHENAPSSDSLSTCTQAWQEPHVIKVTLYSVLLASFV